MCEHTASKRLSKVVAVVVPFYDRSELTDDEKISFRHLNRFLGGYDKYLLVPRGAKAKLSGFGIKRFPEKFFGTAEAHNKLCLSKIYYNAFRDYKFILVYHTDSLVFSDQLKEWCEMDYDFVGAPWIKHENTPYAGNPAYEGKVGGGGFGLIKIETYLKVINSPILWLDPAAYWEKVYASKPKILQLLNYPKKILKGFGFRNNAKWEMSNYWTNEEHFWVHRAPHYYPPFKIAPEEIALRFAFECAPRFCFEKNSHQLPFGCHGWNRYDREFWEPYLLK